MKYYILFLILIGSAVLPVSAAYDSNKTANYVDYQDLVASKSKCTILGFDGIEACSLQSSLTLGIVTTVIIGVVIAVSMITLRKRK